MIFLFVTYYTGLRSADSAQDECLSLSAEAEALKSSLAELQAKLLQVYYHLTFFTHFLILSSFVILVFTYNPLYVYVHASAVI